jgi:outer membrane protein assembly factor BamE
MSRLPSLALTLGLVLLATGCASTRERLASIDLPGIPGVYRATIQQGNVITQEMVDRLKPGMTPSQVRFILGEPILGNTFRDERWDYVYTIQVGAQDRQQQRLTLWFEQDTLARFEGDFLPTSVQKAREAAGEESETDTTPVLLPNEQLDAPPTPTPAPTPAPSPGPTPSTGPSPVPGSPMSRQG